MNSLSVKKASFATAVLVAIAGGAALTGPAEPAHAVEGGITYTIERPASPTPDQEDALARIDAAMAPAVELYNKHSDLRKHLHVHYDPAVATAWGDSGGGIYFGKERVYMQKAVALHEIQHTVGIGTYGEFNELCKNERWTGPRADALMKTWDGPDAYVRCSNQHIFPYGINYPSELNDVSGVRHVQIVDAMNKDMLEK